MCTRCIWFINFSKFAILRIIVNLYPCEHVEHYQYNVKFIPHKCLTSVIWEILYSEIYHLHGMYVHIHHIVLNLLLHSLSHSCCVLRTVEKLWTQIWIFATVNRLSLIWWGLHKIWQERLTLALLYYDYCTVTDFC